MPYCITGRYARDKVPTHLQNINKLLDDVNGLKATMVCEIYGPF